MGGTTERRGLVGGTQEALLVGQVGPALLTAVVAELAGGVQTTGLSLTHLGGVICVRRLTVVERSNISRHYLNKLRGLVLGAMDVETGEIGRNIIDRDAFVGRVNVPTKKISPKG